MLAKKLQGAGGAGGAAGASLAFVVNGSNQNNVVAFDISDPANLSELGSTTDATYLYAINRLAYDANAAILYTGSAGGVNPYVSAWDASNPAALSRISSYTLASNYCWDIKLDTVNQVLYVSSLTSSSVAEIASIDVSNPASMTKLDFVLGNGTPFFYDGVMAIDLDRSLIVLGTGQSNYGSAIINISNPSNLTFYTTTSNTYTTNRPTVGYVDTVQEVAYFNSNQSRIDPIDYSTPSSPVTLPRKAVGDVRWSIALNPDTDNLYAALYFSTAIRAYDSSNPSSITNLGTYTDATNLPTPSCSAIDTATSVLYVGNYFSGSIASVDVSNPNAPTLIDSLASANLYYQQYMVIG